VEAAAGGDSRVISSARRRAFASGEYPTGRAPHRWSPAFGLLAAVQRLGNLAASAVAGLLWTLASPRVAFGYLVAWMLLALVGLLMARRKSA
jgi:hypothetical protein